MTAETIKRIARECGFELAGVAPADPPEDFSRYEAWVAQGLAGEMRYLTDRRVEVRRDVRNLLPNARSVICVGKLYNQAMNQASRMGTDRSVHDGAFSTSENVESGDRVVSPHFLTDRSVHDGAFSGDQVVAVGDREVSPPFRTDRSVHHGSLANREIGVPPRNGDREVSPLFPTQAVISRYAWGADYHGAVWAGLERMAGRLSEIAAFDYKICVDTAPILERTFARLAGLGWIGKNTCLINEPLGSWFFLGEIVTSLEIAADTPPPDRCGTCSRCIDACPTDAFVFTSNHNDVIGDWAPLPDGRGSETNALADGRGSETKDALPDGRASRRAPVGNHWAIDSARCIAYFTIELRGDIPEEHRAAMGSHVFGCDICQDVCPWNSRAPVTDAFDAPHAAPSLEECVRLSEPEFRAMFHDSPITRAKHAGFLRNVAVAMGNSGLEQFRESLERLAEHADSMVAGHARWALEQLDHKMEKRVEGV